MRAARRLLATGDLNAARVELTALGHSEQPRQAEAWADLHLALADRSEEAGAIRREVEQIPPTMPQRQDAAHRLFDVVSKASRQFLAAGRWEQSEQVLAVATLPLRETPRAEPWLAQVNDLRAASQDQAFDKCASDACRLSAARKSIAFATSDARIQRLSDARAKALASLEFRSADGESVLTRLQRVASVAANIKGLGDQQEDGELAARIHSADELVRMERAKVPMMGADAAVLGELLSTAFDPKATTLHTFVSSVDLYTAMRSGRCIGVYMTGADKGRRILNGAARSEATAHLLSQVFGRDIELPAPPSVPAGRGISRSKVGSVPIVGRWNGNQLVELRVGEAKP